MPIFNLTIDDASPLIRYQQSGQWSDSPNNDVHLSSYLNATFHETDIYGATATLTFKGSAIYIFGAFRPNHGVYSVSLDGNITLANGNSNSTESFFERLIFSADELSDDEHQLVLQNQHSTPLAAFVDLDYILVTSGDGNPDTQSKDTIMDDNHPNITYAGDWDDSFNSFSSGYFDLTMHRTNQEGATAEILFEGNAIAVYGVTSKNHAAFNVALDGGAPLSLNGSAPVLRYQNMLYYAGGLSNGSHTLTVSNADNSGLFFDLDKVVVSEWGEWNDTEVIPEHNGTSTNTTSVNGMSKIPTGPVVGGIIAAVVLSIFTAFSVFLFLRRRRQRNSENTIAPFKLSCNAGAQSYHPSGDGVSQRTSQSYSDSEDRQSRVYVLSSLGQRPSSDALSCVVVPPSSPYYSDTNSLRTNAISCKHIPHRNTPFDQ
ncbi:hypothetical protein BC835DRAFT_1310487 [Cytidiella melzeri]|nr:hypothetical protein BC835DRAFT_1310487 [Cytidiella melzeri]